VADRMLQRGKVDEAHAVLSAALSLQRTIIGPDDPATLDTMRSLGTALEADGKLAEAEQMHQEALALWRKRREHESPQGISTVESLARVMVAQRKFSAAEQLLDEAMTPAVMQLPASASLLTIKVDLKGRSGKWAEAAATAAQLVEYRPLHSEHYCPLAALLLKAGDRSGYEQFCKQLLAAATNVSRIFVADAVAKACSFRPVPGLDLQVLDQLSELTVTRGTGDAWALPYFQMCRAMVTYRQGNFVAAADWAQKTITSTVTNAHGYAYGVQAMAYAGLGKQPEARAALAKGEALVPRAMPTELAATPDNSWLAWLFARTVLDEAVDIVQPTSSSEKPAARP